MKPSVFTFFLLCVVAVCLGQVVVDNRRQTRTAGQPGIPQKGKGKCPIAVRAEVEKIRQRAFRDPSDDNLKDFLCTLPRFVNDDTGGTYYVLEGDIPLTEAEVRDYIHDPVGEGNQKEGDEDSRLAGAELTVNLHRGKRDFYKVGSRTLNYAVDRKSFPDEAKFSAVRIALRQAADEWQNLCETCQIKFVDVTNTSVRQRPGTQINFVVRHEDLNGEYIALAFFPHDPPIDRFIYIDPSYYSTDFNPVGVMRHELGHVLGYRHEHITDAFARQVPGCISDENGRWEQLRTYDRHSVMHYYCGTLGSLKLEFTPEDKLGHQDLYGIALPASPALSHQRSPRTGGQVGGFSLGAGPTQEGQL